MKLIKLALTICYVLSAYSVTIRDSKSLSQSKFVSGQITNSTNIIDPTSKTSQTNNAINSDSGEAEIYDPNKPSNTPVIENPPKPLMNKTIIINVNKKIEQMANDPANSAITGVGLIKDSPPKSIEFEPVTYVNELSPAAKLAIQLEESGDVELQKIMNSGFETPKTIANVISDKITRVDKPANLNFFNTAEDPKAQGGYWSNVEYNRYNNRLLDTHRYFTPAKFEKNMLGDVIVHAPSDSAMQITTPAAMTVMTDGSNFMSS